MKKFSNFIAAAALCTQLFNFKADAVAMKEERIYSNSSFLQMEDGVKYTNTIVAYNTGRIEITIQKNGDCLAVEYIGNISFDNNMITAFDEEYSKHKQYSSLVQMEEVASYSNNFITYDFYDNSRSYGLIGALETYTIYVKEPYMDCTIPMTFFGKEIEIPFGENKYDIDTRLDEVEKELYSLKQENSLLIEERDTLLKENEILKNNFADINLDGKISIADVVLLMRYVSGQIDTIPFIVS